jgi:hypothetical protein
MHYVGFTTRHSSEYSIFIFEDSAGLDPIDDNVDVEVMFRDGRRYAATFFSLANLRTLFDGNRASGECAGGLFFWAKHMVIVLELTAQTIETTVAHLIDTGELFEVFEGPLTDEDPEPPDLDRGSATA